MQVILLGLKKLRSQFLLEELLLIFVVVILSIGISHVIYLLHKVEIETRDFQKISLMLQDAMRLKGVFLEVVALEGGEFVYTDGRRLRRDFSNGKLRLVDNSGNLVWESLSNFKKVEFAVDYSFCTFEIKLIDRDYEYGFSLVRVVN